MSHVPSSITAYAFRLLPGEDLRQELLAFVKSHGLEAAAIVTCVGSVKRAALRLSDRSEATIFDGKYEIVSLVGTLDRDWCHLHASLSDADGRTIGGHLQDGTVVHTTAEVVMAELGALRFERAMDPATGYKELTVKERPANRK